MRFLLSRVLSEMFRFALGKRKFSCFLCKRERTHVWEERWCSGGGERTNEKSKGGKASGSILAMLLTRKSDFYFDFLFTF